MDGRGSTLASEFDGEPVRDLQVARVVDNQENGGLTEGQRLVNLAPRDQRVLGPEVDRGGGAVMDGKSADSIWWIWLLGEVISLGLMFWAMHSAPLRADLLHAVHWFVVTV